MATPTAWTGRPATTTEPMTRLGLSLVLLLALAPGWSRAATAGVGLGLFASDPDWDYAPLLDEIGSVPGADAVLLVSPWYQRDVRGTVIRPIPGRSPTLETVRRTAQQAVERGLAVTVMPIVLLEETSNPKEWRGVLSPQHEAGDGLDRWWASYDDVVLAHATVAAEAGATRFVVGSELLSMEAHEGRWRSLIQRVRSVFPGELIYSANWDQYEGIPFLDALDAVGVNAYFRLAPDGARPDADAAVAAWEEHLRALERLRDTVGKPVVITEVGYSSRATAAAKPWCHCPGEPLDIELQATLYEALLRVFVAEEQGPLPVQAWYLWNWFGFGGDEDGTFTPRGKPAEQVLRQGMR